MTKQIITIPATLAGVKRLKDRSVNISFHSLFEMSNDDFSQIDNMFQASGYLLFSDEQLSLQDVPDADISNPDLKSPSARLRAVLYAYHMEKNGDAAKFRSFYESYMEREIERVKEQIDE